MRWSTERSLQVLLLLSLVGCSFSPGNAGAPAVPAGSGGGSGNTGAGAGTGAGTGNATGTGLIGGDITGAAGAGGAMSCGQMNVGIMPLPPDILIIEDRSGSMDNDQNDKACNNGGCGANSKWALVTAAINQVVSTDTNVNWGLKFFADADNQCGVNPGVAVGVATGNSAAIAAAITASTKANGGVNNGSYTPTRAAVNAGAAYLATLTDPNPKYLLVATDGLPNCPPGCGGNGNSCTTTPNTAESTAVEQAIMTAQTAGFKTFVVGIATASDMAANATLNAMAVSGGEAQTGAATSYYSVTDTASLVAALNKIVGLVATCTISLATAPTGFTNVAISATDAAGNTVVIQPDPTNGWSYDATKANIILNGTACTNLQNGMYSNFQFYYACAGQKICIDKNAAGQCAN